jgi:hypothetical protein
MRKVLPLLLFLALFPGAAAAQCAGAEKAAPAEGTKCALPAISVKCHEACLSHDDEVVKTTEQAVVTGTIRCAHCDLHKGDQCRKVLVAAGHKVYRLCPEGLRGARFDAPSGRVVTAKGTLLEVKDGDAVLNLTSIEVKS